MTTSQITKKLMNLCFQIDRSLCAGDAKLAMAKCDEAAAVLDTYKEFHNRAAWVTNLEGRREEVARLERAA